MNRFANKIVVTGGSGIELAAAHKFGREGAKTIMTGRNPEALAAGARLLNKGAE